MSWDDQARPRTLPSFIISFICPVSVRNLWELNNYYIMTDQTRGQKWENYVEPEQNSLLGNGGLRCSNLKRVTLHQSSTSLPIPAVGRGGEGRKLGAGGVLYLWNVNKEERQRERGRSEEGSWSGAATLLELSTKFRDIIITLMKSSAKLAFVYTVSPLEIGLLSSAFSEYYYKMSRNFVDSSWLITHDITSH